MSVTIVLLLEINLEYLKFTMSGCLVHFLSYSIIMTIIDASTPCEALIFPFILSARHACIAFYIFPLSRHFLSKVCFSSRKRVFLVLFNHIISTEGPLSLKHTSFIGVVETCTNLTV